MMNLKYAALIIIGLVGYGVWAFMAWFDASLRHDFLAFNMTMAAGTIGVMVRDMKSPPDSASPPSIAPPSIQTAPTTITKD